jgi:predicted AAA+ superfamily ATPase
MNRYDLYITGSNADMLSSELSTFLAGRYVEILIHPFSFQEFKKLYENSTFEDYIIFGGIPSICSFNLHYDFSMNALRDSYRSAILQDVISRYQIRNAAILEKLIQYVFTNVGKTFSALSISKYFKSQKVNISVDTVLSYLSMLQDAYLIYKVSRNDLIGKSILKTEEKYYIADHGIREAISGNNMKVIESVLENIVYIELLRRGYKVYVGKISDREIDFVAYKNKEIRYYQVSYLMESESTREREFGVYKLIADNYPKYVISMDRVDFSQDGIIHMNIEKFLAEV